MIVRKLPKTTKTIGGLLAGDVFSYSNGDPLDYWMRCIGEKKDGVVTVVNLVTGLVVSNAVASQEIIKRNVEVVEI